MAWEPKEGEKTDIKVEAGVLQSSLAIVSKTELAKRLKCSRQTISRRLKLLAVCLFMVRQFRSAGHFEGIWRRALVHFGVDNCREMH